MWKAQPVVLSVAVHGRFWRMQQFRQKYLELCHKTLATPPLKRQNRRTKSRLSEAGGGHPYANDALLPPSFGFGSPDYECRAKAVLPASV